MQPPKITNVIYKGMPEYSLLIVAIGVCLRSTRSVDFSISFYKDLFCLLCYIIFGPCNLSAQKKNQNSNYIT